MTPSRDTVKEAILEAIAAVGGEQAVLARLIGASPQEVWNWLNRGTAVHPKYCPAIEQETGVSRARLRPWDWKQIWSHQAPKARAAREASRV